MSDKGTPYKQDLAKWLSDVKDFLKMDIVEIRLIQQDELIQAVAILRDGYQRFTASNFYEAFGLEDLLRVLAMATIC